MAEMDILLKKDCRSRLLKTDLDDGIYNLLDSLAILKVLESILGKTINISIFITTNKDINSNYHLETNLPSSMIMRKILHDDENRIRWALYRKQVWGYTPDILFSIKNGRKRINSKILERIRNA